MKVALTDVEQLTGEYHFLRGIFEQLVASINAALNAGGDGTNVLRDDGSFGAVNVTLWNGTAPNNLIAGRVDANAQVVGDKTGYSLTAGSYSVRASSTQRGTVAIVSTSATAGISSVTTTRALLSHMYGESGNADNKAGRLALTNATTITASIADASVAVTVGFEVVEFF
jgi:hypothetical protein